MGWTPSIVPTGSGDAQIIYLVVNNFGHLGTAFTETEVEQADLETVITDLMSGQYSDPVRVVAFNTAENWAEDVSQDVAREIQRRVECDHANRVAVLTRHQIGDDGFKIGLLDFGFGKRGAKVSEIIDDKINDLSVAASGRHNRRGPAHNQLLTQQRPEISAPKREVWKPH